jgi:hypothetical protein
MVTNIRDREVGRRDVLRLSLGAGALSLVAGRSRAQTATKPDVVRIGYLTAAHDSLALLTAKIERWHQTPKNRILPDNYYLMTACL